MRGRFHALRLASAATAFALGLTALITGTVSLFAFPGVSAVIVTVAGAVGFLWGGVVLFRAYRSKSINWGMGAEEEERIAQEALLIGTPVRDLRRTTE